MARPPSFSHAAVIGETIYASGTLGSQPNTMELVPGGTGPQTTRALINIRSVLEACGASGVDVAKVNVFLSDIETFGEMNAAYAESFEDTPPARITVGGFDLALGAAVEIDCIASKPSYSGTQSSRGIPKPSATRLA